VDPKNLIDLVSDLFDFIGLGSQSLHLCLVEGHVRGVRAELFDGSLDFIVFLERLCHLGVDHFQLGCDSLLVDRGLGLGHRDINLDRLLLHVQCVLVLDEAVLED